MIDYTIKYRVPCTHKEDFDKQAINCKTCLCDIRLDKYNMVVCTPDNKNYDTMTFVDNYFEWLLYTNYIVPEKC